MQLLKNLSTPLQSHCQGCECFSGRDGPAPGVKCFFFLLRGVVLVRCWTVSVRGFLHPIKYGTGDHMDPYH